MHPEFLGVCLRSRDGKVELVSCGGLADVEAGREWTVDTPSQIPSISKQLAAALILVQRGTIALEDTVASLLPASPASWREVRLQHLLTHTSGISHWGDDLPGSDPDAPMSPIERLMHLLDAPLLAEPGSSGATAVRDTSC